MLTFYVLSLNWKTLKLWRFMLTATAEVYRFWSNSRYDFGKKPAVESELNNPKTNCMRKLLAYYAVPLRKTVHTNYKSLHITLDSLFQSRIIENFFVKYHRHCKGRLAIFLPNFGRIHGILSCDTQTIKTQRRN